MQFEWDEEKNSVNIKKHGISFEIATGVFFDEYRIERVDLAHSDDEERLFTIGKVQSVLFVVFHRAKGEYKDYIGKKGNKGGRE